MRLPLSEKPLSFQLTARTFCISHYPNFPTLGLCIALYCYKQ